MTLPTSIWYCPTINLAAEGVRPCSYQPVDAVGLRVAGPDDLLIRREDGNIDRIGSDLPNWGPRQPERIQDLARARRQRPGRFAPWERDIGFLIDFYVAALAATEGETP